MTKRMRKLNNRIKHLEAEVIKYKNQAEFQEKIARQSLSENIILKLMLTGKAKIDFSEFMKGEKKNENI